MYRYRYKLKSNKKLLGEHGILREYAIIKSIKENIFIDIEINDISLKNYIDEVLNQSGYEFYSDITNITSAVEKRVFYGNLPLYQLSSKSDNDIIQFTQVELDKGNIVNGFETFIDESKGGKSIVCALYGQQNSADPDGLPYSSLVISNLVQIGKIKHQFLKLPINSQYIIQNSGYYWLALHVNNKVKFASTITNRKGFIKAKWFNKKFDGTLPSQINSGLYDRESSILFVAANVMAE